MERLTTLVIVGIDEATKMAESNSADSDESKSSPSYYSYSLAKVERRRSGAFNFHQRITSNAARFALLIIVAVVAYGGATVAAADDYVSEVFDGAEQPMMSDDPLSLTDVYVNDGEFGGGVDYGRRFPSNRRPKVTVYEEDAESTAYGVGPGQPRSLLHAIAAATAEETVSDGVDMTGDGVGQDPCYENDERRTPKRCVPDFDNAAFERPVEASSTCGNPPVRFCTGGVGGTATPGTSGRGCFVCDVSNARRRHPVSYVNDNNNPTDVTCWISEPVYPQRSQPPQRSQNQQPYPHPPYQQLQQRQTQNVTVTLSLGKKFEVTFCFACNNIRLPVLK